jgi:UDP-glucose 4-epimerase
VPIPESHPKNPENPYGESKLMVENILKWFQKIHGISFAALRYFNASGAALDGSMGESHDPETHIIPKAIQAALTNQPFALFGSDYKTKDGTCVRDYIHVLDLVEAHVLALKKLNSIPGAYCYNVGTGNGFSNKEIVEMVKQVSGIDFKVEIRERRPGDADELVADAAKIINELNFAPKYSDLKTIISTAWQWHKSHS